jgi:hypothetical protein
MSAKERRARRQRHPGVEHPGAPEAARAVLPLAEWKWRTFPVYFAGSLGLFVGVYIGWLAGFIAADSKNQTVTTVVFVISAILLGFALSRVTTRFLLGRRWIKPRPRK